MIDRRSIEIQCMPPRDGNAAIIVVIKSARTTLTSYGSKSADAKPTQLMIIHDQAVIFREHSTLYLRLLSPLFGPAASN